MIYQRFWRIFQILSDLEANLYSSIKNLTYFKINIFFPEKKGNVELIKMQIVFSFVQSCGSKIIDCRLMLICSHVLFLQPNAQTDDDITPLLSSVAAGSLPCLKLLIEV